MTIPEHAYIGSVGYLYTVYTRFCPVPQAMTLEDIRENIRLSYEAYPKSFTESKEVVLFRVLMSLINLWSTTLEQQLALAEETTPPPTELITKLRQEIKEALEDELCD